MKIAITILGLVLISSTVFSLEITQAERNSIIDNAAIETAKELAKQPQVFTDSQWQAIRSAAKLKADESFEVRSAEIMKIDPSIVPAEKTPEEQARLRDLMCVVSKATAKNSYFNSSLSGLEQANVKYNIESNCN